jgi:hypothetical protein
MMGGKLWDEVHMDCLSSEFERPVTPGKDWGFSACCLRWARRGSRSGATTAGRLARVRTGVPSGAGSGRGPVPDLSPALR